LFLLIFSSLLIGELHRLFTINLGLSLGCCLLIRVRSDRNNIMTKITMVVAMPVITSALTEDPYSKPTDRRDRIPSRQSTPTTTTWKSAPTNRAG
jgi:hypothetical protein